MQTGTKLSRKWDSVVSDRDYKQATEDISQIKLTRELVTNSNSTLLSSADVTQGLLVEIDRLGLPLRALAKSLNLPLQTLHSRLSRSRYDWPVDKLVEVADALDLEVEVRLKRKKLPPIGKVGKYVEITNKGEELPLLEI